MENSKKITKNRVGEMPRVDYTSKQINSNFGIRIQSDASNRLVGFNSFISEIGDIELVNKLLRRAFESDTDSVTCRLRRGIRVVFFRR